MKQELKKTNSNQPICSKNNTERVEAGLVPACNRGITLVALIITIIVLLILAVVAITSISNSNIIKHAQNGGEAYQQGKTNEIEKISEYEKYLDENNSNKKDASFKFPKYGVIYSRFNKDDEVQFLIINENGINLYGVTWDGEGAVFGEIQNTTYNDFRTSYRESGIKYEFVDLADAVNEDIEVTKNMGNWTEEEIQEIESIKNDASYCSKAIRSEIEDKGETSIEFYYFKDNYNELIYSSKRHEYTIEERFNNEDKAKLLNLINGDEIYDK